MPPFRDEVVFVITAGSQITRVQYGLPESLTPAQRAVPTRVYKVANDDGKTSFSLEGAESDVIYPIRKGIIQDMDALLYLIESLYRTTTNADTNSPFAPILLTCNSEWQPKQIEDIITHMFKKVHVPAVTIIPESLAALYAYALQIACVVNVGEEKTEITPIIDFNIVESAQAVVEIGGKDINRALQSLLPTLQTYQIEDLKRSPIYEVLNDKSMSFFGEPSAPATSSVEDEGIVDVAAIVANGNAREILAQREQKKSSKQVELKNSEMPRNSFIDSKGQKVEVGTERFKGTEDIIERLSHEIGNVIGKLDDIARRGDCWENIIIVGGPTVIKGFVDAMLLSLQEHFLITRGTTYSELPSGLNTPGYGTPPTTPAVYGQTLGHGQVPTMIKIAKMAEYFIGWKGHTWEDAPFLGSQIAAKQIFTPGIASIDGAYISREDFAERGAREIWNLGLL
ncbi:actin-domain-containing protein [Lipomyces doorenjongii]|uniref:actin-domain-containing protein n=1 Tax=Lipomyces doorenjongii TaxID=383834 RepID=UPI0034CDA22E